MLPNLLFHIPDGILDTWLTNIHLYGKPKFNRLIKNVDHLIFRPQATDRDTNHNLAYYHYFSDAKGNVTEKLHNCLPPNFESWLDFYNVLERENKKNPELELFNGNMITFDYRNKHNKRFLFQIDTDFLKARAFEEMVDKIPPKEKLHDIIVAITSELKLHSFIYKDLRKILADLIFISRK